MRNLIYTLIIIIIVCCGCERRIEQVAPNTTLFLFYPWSTNLTHYFENNIRDFENALSSKEMNTTRIVVFISQTNSTACCYEIKWAKKRIIHDTIAQFDNYQYEYTSTEGLTKLLNIAKGEKAQQFAMIIGCHGDAWIPARDLKRSFGGADIESRIDITTLRQALENSNLTAEYILFDDCYMSSVEVAFELRHVCNHIIASPAEIMAAGMPYSLIAKDLINIPNYSAICSKFYDYYANNPSTPYGAIAVTRCSELDSLANIAKRINRQSTSTTQSLQIYDGYNPHIFYDLGDFMTSMSTNDTLKSEFSAQIKKTVPYKAHTPKVYAYGVGTINIKNYSGISTSEPSNNTKCATWEETSWAKATN